jgi:hypothetical protein
VDQEPIDDWRGYAVRCVFAVWLSKHNGRLSGGYTVHHRKPRASMTMITRIHPQGLGCGRFGMDDTIRGALSQKFRVWRESIRALEDAKASREALRRQQSAQTYDHAVVGYGRLLPQRFATDLVIKFRLKPGKQVRPVTGICSLLEEIMRQTDDLVSHTKAVQH